jgi:hypothetical protein
VGYGNSLYRLRGILGMGLGGVNMKFLRYIGVISLSILPLALYFRFVMDLDMNQYSFPVMFGLGVVLIIFSEIVQYRIKK